MQEDKKFDNWNEIKKKINKNNRKFYVRPREIWYINIWKNIWFESNWKWFNFKRPIIVLKKVWAMFFVASMTTKWKENNFYYKLDKKYFNKDSFISLSQVKIIDQKRFIEKIWKINTEDFLNIKNKLKELLL